MAVCFIHRVRDALRADLYASLVHDGADGLCGSLPVLAGLFELTAS
jgi:hypothetical protein